MNNLEINLKKTLQTCSVYCRYSTAGYIAEGIQMKCFAQGYNNALCGN